MKALRLRRDLSDVLAVMFAVALSTEQSGDQLFLQVIGVAGSGKTRFCDAMLVSEGCFGLEHLTGFHSGFQDGTGKDHSLLARIDRRTLITPEGDVMMSNPKFTEIMSQQRRIFDGTSGATFKNSSEDKRYTGLRTPWIMAGTPALMATDQSRLGDRFLRVFLEEPDDVERAEILKRVAHAAWRAVDQSSNCDASTTLSPEMLLAYSLTGGYVDHLRANASQLLSGVEADVEDVVDVCSRLGEFTAKMRARPEADLKKDVEASSELPTRLTHQFIRLAKCLAVVCGTNVVDAEVLRMVTKVALDTGRGRTLNLVRTLIKSGREGIVLAPLSHAMGEGEDKVRTWLRFLQKIRVAESWQKPAVKGARVWRRWRLTEAVESLAREVLS